jgi:hypothetical protein
MCASELNDCASRNAPQRLAAPVRGEPVAASGASSGLDVLVARLIEIFFRYGS